MGRDKKPLNILQLISSVGYFGGENVLVELASQLKGRELCRSMVGIFNNFKNPHLEVAEVCQKKNIETHVFPCKGKLDLQTIMHLRRFIRENEIDIVHSHGYKANLYSYFASYGMSTRRLATCHNWLGMDARMKFYANLDRFFLRQFDKVVAVSQNVRGRIIDSRIPPEKVIIIPNGISLNRFNGRRSREDVKKDLGIRDGTIVIGTVGRLSEEKGHRSLLRVASAVLKEQPKTVFLVVGDGPLREELERECISSSIIFTGIRNDVADLYQCMDVFVLPSITEGLPMVLLEAMASELPAVATRVGAVPDVIKDGENGFLVDPGDEESLKMRLIYLMTNLDFGRKMGRNGYQWVRDHYSSAQMAQNYITIYLELNKRYVTPS